MGDYGVADEIAKLGDLRDRGLLSEREFADRRTAVLRETRGGGRRRLPALAVIGVMAILVALVAGLFEGKSPSSTSDGPVHLSLASETSTENAAVNWASSLLGTDQYDGLCLSFVVEAYEHAGFSIRNYASINANTYPIDVWTNHHGGITGGPSTSPPAGALFFWNNTHGRDLTHVAISTGGWNFISTADAWSDSVHRETMAEFNKNSWAVPLGWWLPDGSNAPPPATAAPAPTSTPATPPLSVSSGSGGAASGGSTPQVSSGGSTPQPASGSIQGGGSSTPQPGSGSIQGGGSSTAPPASGSTTSGGGTSTPTPATGTGNSSPVTPPAGNSPVTPPVTTPPPVTTYPETVGGVSHTWTDYSDAGGNQGPSIASNQTVQISCKVSGFRVADGNTWWYRIASSPWSDSYYVSADAFYNDGATSGSLIGTPFVDPAVPSC